MTRRPDDRHIDDLCRILRDANISRTGRRLKDVLDADRRGGPATIDGYPVSTMGGSSGTAELTSVENAAALRIAGRNRDPIHDFTVNAMGYLDQCVHSWNALAATLDRIDILRAIGPDSGEPGCESCARHHDSRGMETWVPCHTATRTDVAGRLTEPRWLCAWCYKWVLGAGELPNREMLRQHHDLGRVRREA